MEHYSRKKHTTILPLLAFGSAIAAVCLLLLLLPAKAVWLRQQKQCSNRKVKFNHQYHYHRRGC